MFDSSSPRESAAVITPAASLGDRYAALRLELTRLYSEPVPDPVAIDATMKEIDAVHRHFKDITGQRDDPQRF